MRTGPDQHLRESHRAARRFGEHPPGERHAERDASGGYLATLGAFSNVTEVRRTEEALGQGEQCYRTILEDMEAGHCELDLKGTNTCANEAFGRIWGLTRDELAGRGFGSLMAPENAERTCAAFNRVFKPAEPA